MKIHNKFLVVFAAVLYVFIFPNQSFSQNSNASNENTQFRGYWSVNLNGGTTLFWGDLRQNALIPVFKNENEVKIGYGLIINRQISPIFGVRGQIMNGQLSGTKRSYNRYFIADIFETNINATVNLSNLFFQYKPQRLFSVYGMLGIGLTNWCTKVKVLGTHELVSENGCDNGLLERKKETVIPVGLGVDFRLNDNWFLNFESTLHGVNSDEVDMKEAKFKYDMYSYTSLGVSYKFNNRRKKTIYAEESIQEFPDEEILLDNKPKVNVISEMPEMIYSGDEFIVKLIVNKENIDQGGQIIQYFPEGFLPISTILTKGNFMFEEQTLTINWDELPDNSVFTTSYKVLTESLPTYNYLVIGKLIYSDNDKERSIDFENIIKVEQRIKEITEDEKVLEDQAKEIIETEKILEDKVEEIIVKQKEYQVEEKVVEIPPISDIEYRVQIRAKYGEKLPLSWFADNYNLHKDIKEDYYKGYYIYTIGSFPNFQGAGQYSYELMKSNNVKGPFVVAFRNGKRVPLGELTSYKKAAPVISVNGIEYRVQIRAKFGEKVSKKWLAEEYNIDREIMENLHNGYYIYTLGSFSTYEAARKYRDELRLINKIAGAFVVAFKNGKRFNSLEDISR